MSVYRARGVKMLAEKVETHDEFLRARNAGYHLFQGYFFAKPVVVRGKHIPATKIACLRLLREVAQPELDFERVIKLVAEDVSLCYKLLRYVNSALFGRRNKTQCHPKVALIVLGELGVRRWAALATLPAMAEDKPSEVVTLSLLRAKFCECLVHLAGLPLCNQAFMMGMFSLLDALIDRPLDEALNHVNLETRVMQALTGTSSEQDVLSRVYRLVRRYETGDWGEVEELARVCQIPTEGVGRAYADAARWAEGVLRGSVD